MTFFDKIIDCCKEKKTVLRVTDLEWVRFSQNDFHLLFDLLASAKFVFDELKGMSSNEASQLKVRFFENPVDTCRSVPGERIIAWMLYELKEALFKDNEAISVLSTQQTIAALFVTLRLEQKITLNNLEHLWAICARKDLLLTSEAHLDLKFKYNQILDIPVAFNNEGRVTLKYKDVEQTLAIRSDFERSLESSNMRSIMGLSG
ncbi:hypothetical protein [Coxiella burnetii]|uniref:hypothetical protein n=1 Tax=Coxiella burnetii TaxID=777 RepID=UPI001F355253|nr:hypothetical protein [Coxiella burnetii]